jgi:cytochrome c-type biogenesis protein CcmH/NrfG
MTVVLISGGLTFVVGLLILRPFSVTGGRLHVRAYTPDDDRRRELLRQLRDLDDDLAAGKLTQVDHVRLRGPVEREAAAALRRTTQGPAGGTAVVASSTRPGSATSGSPHRRDAAAGARRRRGRTMTLLALAGAATSITILLAGTASPRHPGQTVTGNSVPGANPVQGSPSGPAPASQSGHQSPTPPQLAAVAAAEAQVKQNPKDVSAHLALADAYAAAGASQLAAVEYLAVTRLDPANAEANTNLALLAFEVGRAAQGKAMVDHVLAANPNYPEALYVRGLINLIGLRRPTAAERDFNAYLAVAPFGSHRTAAVTLLALAESQDHQ